MSKDHAQLCYAQLIHDTVCCSHLFPFLNTPTPCSHRHHTSILFVSDNFCLRCSVSGKRGNEQQATTRRGARNTELKRPTSLEAKEGVEGSGFEVETTSHVKR